MFGIGFMACSPEHSFGEDCVAGLQILPGTTFPAPREETLELRVDVLQLHVEIGGGDLNLAALSHPSLMTRVKSTFLPVNLPLQFVNVIMIKLSTVSSVSCIIYPTFRLLSTCRDRSWEEWFHKESRFRWH